MSKAREVKVRPTYEFSTPRGNVNARVLAKRAGITTVTMSRILNGHSVPRMETLTKLATALHISIEEAHTQFVLNRPKAA